MPATWNSASTANRFEGDCLDLADATQGHAWFEYSDDLENRVANYGADLGIDFELVLAAGHRGGVIAGDRGRFAAGKDCACASERPAKGVLYGGKACWWSLGGLSGAF